MSWMLAADTGAVWRAAWQFVAQNWALCSISITITFLVVTSWLVLRKYVRLCLNIIKDTPPPLAMGPRDFQRIEGERVTFRAFDNLNLCGMFLSGAGQSGGRRVRSADGNDETARRPSAQRTLPKGMI